MKKVLIIAKKETVRPMKSKSTSLSLATLAISLIFFHFAFPAQSFAQDLGESAGSQNLYTVAVINDTDLEDAIRSSKKYMILQGTDKQSADITLKSNGGKLSHTGATTVKSQMALYELEAVLRDFNKRSRDSEVLKNQSVRFILYPLWIDMLNESNQPDNFLDLRLENASLGAKIDLGNLSVGAQMPEDLETQLISSPIVKYFLVFIPILFFSIYFSSTILREKVGRRGTYLFSSPLTRTQIVVGKVLPSFIMIIITLISITLIQELDIIPTLSVFLPLAIACLGLALMVACLSNTPHDLNITLTFIFMLIFAYIFYPAMFAGLSKVSLVSPLGALLEYVDGKITSYELGWLLLPLVLSAVIIWVASIQLFNHDVLFSQENTLYKLYHPFQLFLKKSIQPYGIWAGIALGGVVLLPIVYLLEVYLLFLLLPFGYRFLYIMVPLAAFMEEFVKVFSIGAFTRLKRIPGGWRYGVVAGFGFYAAERLLLAGVFYGMISRHANLFLLSASLLITMFIHMFCSSIAAQGIGKSQGKIDSKFLPYILLSVAIHTTYNLYVMGLIS